MEELFPVILKLVDLCKITSEQVRLTFKKESLLVNYMFNFIETHEQFSNVGVVERIRSDFKDTNPATVVNAYKEVKILKDSNPVFKKMTNLELVSNPDEILASDQGKEHLKIVDESLKKLQIDIVNRVLDVEAILSLANLFYQIKVVKETFDEIREAEQFVKDDQLFKSIDDKVKEINEKLNECQQEMENQQFEKAKPILRKLYRKLEDLKQDLYKIQLKINEEQVSLNHIIKSSNDAMFLNTLKSASSWYKLINYSYMTTANKIYAILEAIGFTALVISDNRAISKSHDLLFELSKKLNEAKERMDNINNIEEKIDDLLESINKSH